LLPTTGYGTWRHLIMPALTLASYPMAAMARLVVSGMLEVLDADYVRTARAKGLRERLVVLKHALKNAAMPIVTVIGLQFGLLLGGALVCEMIFACPGGGRLMIFAIYNRDFPLVEAAVFVMAMVFVLGNLLVDVCYAWLDPRVGLRRGGRGPGWARAPGSWRGHLRLSLVLAALPIVAAAVCAILAPQLAPYPPAKSDLSARLRPPAWMARGSAAPLLGTDQLGRDILSRLVYGARVSLLVGTVSSLLGGTIGLALGLLSGYLRGRSDSVVAKLIDIQLAFPFLLFAITVIAVLGPSLRNLLVILALSGWVTYARVVRGQTLSLREMDFVQSARSLGC